MKSKPISEQLRDILNVALNRVQPRKERRKMLHSLGVDPAVVNRFVSGQRGMNMESLDLICEALGIDLVQRRSIINPDGPTSSPPAQPAE